MNIYLTIVVVLCTVEVGLALKKDPVLVTKELNHNKGEDRVTQFECTYELETEYTAERLAKLTVEKKKDHAPVPIFTRTKVDEKPEIKGVDGEITLDNIKLDDDVKKNGFTITKATKVEGYYTCAVETYKGKDTLVTYAEGFSDVKAARETVEFKIAAEGAKDDKKTEFNHDNKLDASLEYAMADKSVLVKAEFKKDDLVYFRYTADGEKLESVDDAKDKGVKAAQVTDFKHDKDKHLLTLVIKDLVKETEGKYDVKFYYKEASDKDTIDFMSKDITLKYTGEKIDFQIHEKDDKENKHEFKKDNQIDATFEYVLATGSEFSKVEFLKVDKVFFRISKDGDKDKLEPLNDAKDIGVKKEMVDGKRDGTNPKVLVTIKDTYKETGGNFKAVLYYKEKAGADDSHIESGNIELKYTGGAATTMASFASISTLLLAFAFVRSNF